MTRLLREHPAIEVETDASGRLSAIRWNGRREPVEVCNRWRVEEAWWGEPIARDYVKVVGQAVARAHLPRSNRRNVAPGAPVRLARAQGRQPDPVTSRIRASAGRRTDRQADDKQDREQADDEDECGDVTRLR